MEEVEEICTRIAIIDHGKIIAEGTKGQLKAIITNQKNIGIEVRSAENLDRSKLAGIAGVNQVEVEDRIIKITSDSEVNNLNRIIQQLMADDIEIRSVEEHEPSLETVFLTLTGRSLRD
jgi:ABC-2 type transport system ATP-binding protein